MSESADRGSSEPVEVLDEAPTASSSEDLDTDGAAESTVADAPARAFVPDEVLLGSVDLARRALLEVTAPETVGSVVGHLAEDEHVLTLLFASDLSGYPGWRWSVTLARVEGGEPTVLETELMPGETALLAPEWVPWSERLAEYRAAQEAAAAASAEATADDRSDSADEALAADVDDEDDEDDDFDEEDDDEDDEDDDFEGGDDAELAAAFGDDSDEDFDGIDIDALDDSAADEEADDLEEVDDDRASAGHDDVER